MRQILDFHIICVLAKLRAWCLNMVLPDIFRSQAMAGSHISICHLVLSHLRDCRTTNPHLASCPEFFSFFRPHVLIFQTVLCLSIFLFMPITANTSLYIIRMYLSFSRTVFHSHQHFNSYFLQCFYHFTELSFDILKCLSSLYFYFHDHRVS